MVVVFAPAFFAPVEAGHDAGEALVLVFVLVGVVDAGGASAVEPGM